VKVLARIETPLILSAKASCTRMACAPVPLKTFPLMHTPDKVAAVFCADASPKFWIASQSTVLPVIWTARTLYDWQVMRMPPARRFPATVTYDESSTHMSDLKVFPVIVTSPAWFSISHDP